MSWKDVPGDQISAILVEKLKKDIECQIEAHNVGKTCTVHTPVYKTFQAIIQDKFYFWNHRQDWALHLFFNDDGFRINTHAFIYDTYECT